MSTIPDSPDSPEVSGPRKCKLSTKVVTSGDPNAERKWKKLEQVEQKGKATAPTKKKQGPAKTTTTVKAAPQL